MTGSDIDPLSILGTLGDFPDATCTPLTGGIDARMWRVDWRDKRYALRLLGPHQAPQAAREIAIANWARAHRYPVPQVIAAGTWHGQPANLQAWATGETIGAVVTSLADAPAATSLGWAFGQAQARLHTLPPPETPEIATRDWRTWRPLGDDLAQRLATAADGDRRLLHLDYHPLNVLTADGRVSAVLDWANAHIGDPRVDLARTLSLLELAPLADEGHRAAVQAFTAGWQEGYAAAAGWFEVPPLLRWWAGEAMVQDLAPHVGSTATPWLDEAHLARIRAWTDAARTSA